MTLQEELKPHFDAILTRLERQKVERPMAQVDEALRVVRDAAERVARIGVREKYLTETLQRKDGTILVYLEGDRTRPVRRRVVRVQRDSIVTDWPSQLTTEHRFSRLDGKCLSSAARSHLPVHELDSEELLRLNRQNP